MYRHSLEHLSGLAVSKINCSCGDLCSVCKETEAVSGHKQDCGIRRLMAAQLSRCTGLGLTVGVTITYSIYKRCGVH